MNITNIIYKMRDQDKSVYKNKIYFILDNIRGKLQNALGIEVIRAGIGNKV